MRGVVRLQMRGSIANRLRGDQRAHGGKNCGSIHVCRLCDFDDVASCLDPLDKIINA